MVKGTASRRRQNRPLPLQVKTEESTKKYPPTITSSNKKPSSSKAISKSSASRKSKKAFKKKYTSFYAIRECDSLDGPALFFSWKDCSFYLDPDENDGPVEYKEFDILQEAFDYILSDDATSTDDDETPIKRKETSRASNKRTAQEVDESSSASPLPRKKQKTTPTKQKAVVATKASSVKMMSFDESRKEPPKAKTEAAAPAPFATKEQLPAGFPNTMHQPFFPMMPFPNTHQFPFSPFPAPMMMPYMNPLFCRNQNQLLPFMPNNRNMPMMMSGPVLPASAGVSPMVSNATAPSPMVSNATTPSPMVPNATAPSPMVPKATALSPMVPKATTPSPMVFNTTAPSPMVPKATALSPMVPNTTAPSVAQNDRQTSVPAGMSPMVLMNASTAPSIAHNTTTTSPIPTATTNPQTTPLEDAVAEEDEAINLDPDPSAVATAPIRHQERFWERRFSLFKAFKETYGHLRPSREMDLPSEFEEIKKKDDWMYRQKQQVALWDSDPTNFKFGTAVLNVDRVERLKELFAVPEFVNPSSTLAQRERVWEHTFRLFHDFKATYGHLKPQKVKEQELDSKFDVIKTSTWIYKQRKQLELWVNDNKSEASALLNDDRVARLKELLASYRSHVEEKWEERYTLFKEFQDTYGHLRVSKEKDLDPKFEVLDHWTGWLKKQRRILRLSETDRTSVPQFMTESHIQRLKDLGVGEELFEKCNPVNSDQEKWQAGFDLLKEYKEKYKTCSFTGQVEKLEEKFRGLGPYISEMRKQVKLYKENPESSKILDEDKYKQLLDLEIGGRRHPVLDAGESCDPLTPEEQAEREKEWQAGFTLLLEYKEKYNTCSLPRQMENLEENFKPLVAFLRETRKQIKLYIQAPASSSILNEDKYNQLKDLGVQSCKKKDPATKAEEERTKWEEMFQQLEAFKESGGDIRAIPNEHEQLSIFASKQRKLYKGMKDGQVNGMTAQRVARLVELGFRLKTEPQYSFDVRIQQWQEYIAKHGSVPSVGHPLKGWASKTKRNYIFFLKGQKSTLTQERVDRLTELGFQWPDATRVQNYTAKRRPVPWETSFKYLLDYKKRYGDTVVPQHYQEHNLGAWVHQQRREYKKLLDGKRSLISLDTRLAKLSEVGFVWCVKPRRRSTNRQNHSDVGSESSSESGEEEEQENGSRYPWISANHNM